MTCSQDISVVNSLDPNLFSNANNSESTPQIITFSDIVEYFKDIKDPRCPINLVYPLEAVVVIAVMGILAGANGPTAIAKWAKLQRHWLSQVLTLPENRTPSKDVFLNVLALLNPAKFQDCFRRWIQSIKLNAMDKLEIDRPIYSVDGKTLRRSHDKKKGLKALHSVSIWASELGLTLAAVACEEKSNEITAMPVVLNLVELKGTIVTSDAMGCQKAIAKIVIDKGGDYIFSLKGNQGNLHDEVEAYIHEKLESDFHGCNVEQFEVTEKLHGKLETRIYTQMKVPENLSMLPDWPGLKSIGTVTRFYQVDGGETSDVRLFISSLELDVKEFARGVRGHWGIENPCHYTLDMTFREDYSRLREEQGRQNFAFLNRLALSLLNQHDGKESISLKRQACGWSPEFLLQVLTGSKS